MEIVKCSICEKEINTLYCGDCGQKITRKKTTMLSMLTDFLMKLVSFEKSVIATFGKILKNPKAVVQNYMDGNRNYYSHPGAMLFWALTFGALHVFFVNDKILGGSFELDTTEGGFTISAEAGILGISLILFFLCSSLAFIRSRQGVAKHLISNVYISSAFFIIFTILMDLIGWLFSLDEDSGIGMLIFIVFSLFWLSRVLTKSEKKYMIWLNFLLELAILTSFLLIINFSTK